MDHLHFVNLEYLDMKLTVRTNDKEMYRKINFQLNDEQPEDGKAVTKM